MMNTSPALRLVDAAATRAALPFERLIPALRERFAEGCEAPPRLVLDVGAVPAACTSLVMPAWVPGRWYGVKIINIALGNGAQGLPGLHASYLLHDAATGVPQLLIDGDELTARRTAATAALAASWLAREDSVHLLVVGSGRIARLLPAAYRVVRPIRRVSVWSPTAAHAQALAHQLRGEGFEAGAVTDLEAGVRAADIVSCATLASTPLVQGAWLAEGSHLDLIGSFTPAMREADDACLAGATLVVDTEEALAKSGDLIGPLERGVIRADGLHGTLATLARGEATGRRTATERTVFKSVGHALEDLAAAMLVHATPGPPGA